MMFGTALSFPLPVDMINAEKRWQKIKYNSYVIQFKFLVVEKLTANEIDRKIIASISAELTVCI